METNNEKKDIGSLFDRIAKSYDLLNHLLSFNMDRRWRKKAVQAIEGRCEELLDVAAGTGDLSLEIVRQDKAAKIVGIDLSEQMIAKGKEKIAKAGLDARVELLKADCCKTKFEGDRFDCATCAFGVRNFARLEESLSEICRVLRPGGQFVVLEFSYPKNALIRFFYNIYFTMVLPLVGKIVSKDKKAYTYLPQSVKGFIQGEKMTECLEKAGFERCSYKSLSFGICTLYSGYKKEKK